MVGFAICVFADLTNLTTVARSGDAPLAICRFRAIRVVRVACAEVS